MSNRILSISAGITSGLSSICSWTSAIMFGLFAADYAFTGKIPPCDPKFISLCVLFGVSMTYCVDGWRKP